MLRRDTLRKPMLARAPPRGDVSVRTGVDVHLVLTLLLTASAADPADPADPAATDDAPLHPGAEDAVEAIDVEGWSVLAYNGYLVDSSFRVSSDLEHAVEKLPKDADPERLADFRRQLRDAFVLGEQRLARLPGWHGDTAFRDTALEAVHWGAEAIDHDVAELHALVLDPTPTNADLARAEAIVRGINEAGHQWDATLKAAQRRFAEGAGFKLVEPPPAPPRKAPPTFTAPGIPPVGSALPASAHVGFATRYHNALVTTQIALLAPFNDFVASIAGGGAGAEAARITAVGVARELEAEARAVGDWQGDASLRDATVELAATFVRVLDQPAAEATRLLQQETLTDAERARYELVTGIIDQDSVARLRRWGEVDAAFRERWGMVAWEAWVAAHP